jgi:hypothetical protein
VPIIAAPHARASSNFFKSRHVATLIYLAQSHIGTLHVYIARSASRALNGDCHSGGRELCFVARVKLRDVRWPISPRGYHWIGNRGWIISINQTAVHVTITILR